MLGFHIPRRLLTALFVVALPPSTAVDAQSPANLPSAHAKAPVSGLSGEKLTYSIEWRLITAGTATLEHSGAHLLLKLESAGLVSKLFRIDDSYAVDYDSGLCAKSLHLDAQEGRRHRDTRVTFDRTRNRADYLERDLVKNSTVKQDQIDVPHCVHDVPGALHALRSMHIDVGKSVELPISDGKKFAMVRIEAQEREVIKVKGQPVKTIRYEAFLFNNVIYARKARLFVWLSEDARKTPVQIQVRMNFPIGTVTLNLDKEESS